MGLSGEFSFPRGETPFAVDSNEGGALGGGAQGKSEAEQLENKVVRVFEGNRLAHRATGKRVQTKSGHKGKATLNTRCPANL